MSVSACHVETVHVGESVSGCVCSAAPASAGTGLRERAEPV